MDDQQAAKVALALAHPCRIAIVRDLDSREGEPTGPGDFHRRVRGHGTLSRVNYHFRELRRLGVTSLVEDEGEGSRSSKSKLQTLTPGLGRMAAGFVSAVDLEAAEEGA